MKTIKNNKMHVVVPIAIILLITANKSVMANDNSSQALQLLYNYNTIHSPNATTQRGKLIQYAVNSTRSNGNSNANNNSNTYVPPGLTNQGAANRNNSYSF